MKTNSIKNSIAACLGMLLISGAAQATALLLPEKNEMSVGVYHDFNIYSLDLLQQCAAAGDSRCLPSGPYPVQSNEGAVSELTVILSGVNGNNVENFTIPFPTGSAVDNPFITPEGNQSNTFTTTASNEPDPTFTGDQTGTWEININLLNGYLDGSDLIFLFDNNQAGSTASQWLQVFGQVSVIDAAGNPLFCFEISGRSGTGCGSRTLTSTDWLGVAGNFCVDKKTGISFKTDGTATKKYCEDNNGYFIENNLSTSVYEFAAFNQYLNDHLEAWGKAGYLLSVYFDYYNNNAGHEQLTICGGVDHQGNHEHCYVDQKVPEPGSMLLTGLGLFALAALRRRKQQA